jgi:hypothetical protein
VSHVDIKTNRRNVQRVLWRGYPSLVEVIRSGRFFPFTRFSQKG